MSFPCPKCGRALVKSSFTPGGKQRWICRSGGQGRSVCYNTTNPASRVALKQDGTAQAPMRKPAKFNRSLKGSNRFIVTAAQNATPVHTGFLKSLEAACNALDAELIVVPIRYKNPTSRWTESQANEEVWDPTLAPYLVNTRKRLNKHLMLLADVKTQPTANAPLAGFEAITAGESCILAHTKLQLKTVATPQNRFPKLLATTGACTQTNYTDSKAGALGKFHHSLAASMVEIHGGKFHLRQLHADSDSGAFIDLDKKYSPKGVSAAPRALALILGDTHVDFVNPAVVEAVFGRAGMVDALRPTHIVHHDLLDGFSVNPHHNGNPFNAIAKIHGDRTTARAEVHRALEFIGKHTPASSQAVVVASNHDDFLSRWIVSQDWRTAPANAEFYLETALAMVRGTRLGAGGTEYPAPFTYWGRKLAPGVRFLDRDESFTLGGVELGIHGDKGPNGARGSRMNLRRIGIRTVVGHSHSPGIEEGCYQVGTSTHLKLEYVSGPSGWLNTCCVLYANGKRSLLNVVDGAWRLH